MTNELKETLEYLESIKFSYSISERKTLHHGWITVVVMLLIGTLDISTQTINTSRIIIGILLLIDIFTSDAIREREEITKEDRNKIRETLEKYPKLREVSPPNIENNLYFSKDAIILKKIWEDYLNALLKI